MGRESEKLGELSICKASVNGVKERERNWVEVSRLRCSQRPVWDSSRGVRELTLAINRVPGGPRNTASVTQSLAGSSH